MAKFIRLPGCFHLEVGFHSFLKTLDLHLILSELKDSWTSEHAVYLAHLISVSSFVSTPVQQSKTSQIFETWSVANKNSSKPCPSVSLLQPPIQRPSDGCSQKLFVQPRAVHEQFLIAPFNQQVLMLLTRAAMQNDEFCRSIP